MDLTHAKWRKSSYSAGNEGECVEVTTNLRDIIAVRDSKNPSHPPLIITRGEWTKLIDQIKENEI